MKTTDKTTAWKEIRCASLRFDDLRVLADLRGRATMRVIVAEDRAWVCWQDDSELAREVLIGRILPLEGVELFTERGGRWYRLGGYLPAFDVPFRHGEDGVLLDRLVIPGKLSGRRPGGRNTDAVRIGLVPDQREEVWPATAFKCSLEAVSIWAEQATSFELSPLRGAWRRAFDGEDGDADAFVIGPAGRLPLLPESVRYWGTDLFVPLGFRADPDLPEGAIRRILGAGAGDLVVLEVDGFELIARGAFQPLCRAGIRLARGGFSGSWPQEGSRT